MTWHPLAAPALSSWATRAASRCPVAEPWRRAAGYWRSRLQTRPSSPTGRVSAPGQASARTHLPACCGNAHPTRLGQSLHYRGLDLKKPRGQTFRKADCMPEVENGWRPGIECPRSRIEASRDFLYLYYSADRRSEHNWPCVQFIAAKAISG